jgi:hypothetical protein
MSDGISKWHDDMDRYEALCKRYDEPVQYQKSEYDGRSFMDCTGDHYQYLRDMSRCLENTIKDSVEYFKIRAHWKQTYLDTVSRKEQEAIRLKKLKEDTLNSLTAEQKMVLKIREWDL